MKTRSTFANLAIGDLLITAGSLESEDDDSVPDGYWQWLEWRIKRGRVMIEDDMGMTEPAL